MLSFAGKRQEWMERTKACSGKEMIDIMKRRVVVTGLGAVTPIGIRWMSSGQA